MKDVLLAHGYYDRSMMGYGNDMSWAGALLMLLIWAVIIGTIIYIVRILAQHSRGPGSGYRDPLDIARERFAKGEITKEELAVIKKELK